MQFASLLHQYHDAFQTKYASRLLPGHLHAIEAISRCRTPEAGEVFVQCSDCGHAEWRPRSCGHRSCPQCQKSRSLNLAGSATEQAFTGRVLYGDVHAPIRTQIPGLG